MLPSPRAARSARVRFRVATTVMALATGVIGRSARAYPIPDAPNPKDYQPAPPGSGIYLGRLLFSPWISASEGMDNNIFTVENGLCGRRLRSDTNGDGLYDSLTCARTLQPESTSILTGRGPPGLQ